MVTVTTPVRVHVVSPETRDVLLTSKHAQKIIDSYTDNWHKHSDMFVYYNPLISYNEKENVFYITYELLDENDFVNSDFFVTMSCSKQIVINKKKYDLRVEIM